jgi:serine/threonine-protein kinase RsbW
MREQALLELRRTVAATPEQLGALHALLECFWTRLGRQQGGPPERRGYLAFSTAVIEIGTNIVRHAYAGQAVPGPLQLRLRATSSALEAQFTDCGLPFRPPPASPVLTEGTAAPDAAPAEGGYGLALARAALDQLSYARTKEGRNRWRLVRRLPARTPAGDG